MPASSRHLTSGRDSEAMKNGMLTKRRPAKKAKKSGKVAQRKSGELAKYDPKKGLARVAVAEVAEKHYARAKDVKGLEKAIRAKLEAQAEFVEWWDNHVEGSKPGRPQKNLNRSVKKKLRLGHDGLPDPMVVSRWRKKLKDPGKFEAAYEDALERYRKLLEFEPGAHVGQNTGEYEWYTPAEYIEAARKVLGAIDLDPATTEKANEVVQAAQIFTVKNDTLNERWDGRVWMNPPYSQPLITQFCKKLAESFTAGTVISACVLVNNATETEWFRSLVEAASAICFPAGRVRFWSPKKESATPLQGQAVFYIGDDASKFFEGFRKFGFLVMIQK